MPQSANYPTIRDPRTGRRRRLHRVVAETLLGRPLLASEVVHHRDGDRTNNAPSNLIVLPSQRYHAHIEYHLRCQRRGMPFLFPELLIGVLQEQPGTLFEHLY
ncbi:HNH endonuclease [Deinococcus depolymerans]|uniref:HNH endonuclease n=1 Tax=Deinococcus depolymerans TaxID=392408 RepID=UPI003097BF71